MTRFISAAFNGSDRRALRAMRRRAFLTALILERSDCQNEETQRGAQSVFESFNVILFNVEHAAQKRRR